MIPRRIPKPTKRASRWRSQAHCNFVRSHACCNCGSATAIEVAHVRVGSGAGMGQKPDDWNTVSLCRDCHQRQHTMGEVSFWNDHIANSEGREPSVFELIDAFCKASPKAADIRRIQRERGQ